MAVPSWHIFPANANDRWSLSLGCAVIYASSHLVRKLLSALVECSPWISDSTIRRHLPYRRAPGLHRLPGATAPRGHTALGALLVERGLITESQLEAAIHEQKTTGRRLGQVLVDHGVVTPDALLEVLSIQLGVPTTRVNAYTVNPEALAALPEKVARRHTAFPLQKTGTTLLVALPVPKDLTALDDLRFASGCEIQTVLALEDEIVAALNRYYCDEWLPDIASEDAKQVVIDSPTAELELLARDEAAERSAASVLERVIARAATDGASDIHFERRQDDFHVRFRVDGTFREIAVLPSATGARARVAHQGALGHGHRRASPATGRPFQRDRRRTAARYAELDVSDRARREGGSAPARRRPPAAAPRQGGDERWRRSARCGEMIHRPEGIILITGPTGSGKTSTLYAALGELIQTGKNIVTIEDPVEYALPGVNQGQTNDKAGFTFANGLRAILRQDPDVIMVGEIRDSETLEVAIEASLTGHLVLSTLHTNSAVATIARLTDMGLEPYLLASSRDRHRGAATRAPGVHDVPRRSRNAAGAARACFASGEPGDCISAGKAATTAEARDFAGARASSSSSRSTTRSRSWCSGAPPIVRLYDAARAGGHELAPRGVPGARGARRDDARRGVARDARPADAWGGDMRSRNRTPDTSTPEAPDG